jgi:hypothetical protein
MDFEQLWSEMIELADVRGEFYTIGGRTKFKTKVIGNVIEINSYKAKGINRITRESAKENFVIYKRLPKHEKYNTSHYKATWNKVYVLPFFVAILDSKKGDITSTKPKKNDTNDWNDKKGQIISTIKKRVPQFDSLYRKGPSLYFYKRAIQLRQKSKNIKAFLKNDYNLEILYATLVSWDMNSRGAKMKEFTAFKKSLLDCIPEFEIIEENTDMNTIFQILEKTFEKLHVMEGKSKLVSNSKMLHFLFPHLFMPMDGKNTLYYFYNNTNESVKKYISIIKFSNEIMKESIDWNSYLNNGWNTTPPKIIDNAILLCVNKSIKRG